MYDKKEIKSAFKRATDTYESNNGMQEYAISVLFDLLSKDDKKVKKILEIGAGTGSLTKKIRDKYPDTQYFVNDLVDDYKEIYQKMNCTAVMGDATEIDLPKDCDLVISANCFQWIEDIDVFFRRLNDVLVKGGRLVFSTFGTNHFEELKKVSGVGLSYYSAEQISEILEDSDFNVTNYKQEKSTLYFDSAHDMFRYFSLSGVRAVGKSKIWTPRRLAVFEKQYKESFSSEDEKMPLSVHYLWFSCEKK